MLVSNCCEARMLPDTDICSDCEDHAVEIVLPTTHLEKTQYLYGDIPLEELEGELTYLNKRVQWLEENMITILALPTTSTTYKHATDIINAQKLFRAMIAEIKDRL